MRGMRTISLWQERKADIRCSSFQVAETNRRDSGLNVSEHLRD